ncbi:M20 family metallopeptidase [bacterium]|nr:M20 family metallopeptidase [bacterium]
MNNKIKIMVENSYDELVQLLKELIEQDTTNLPGNEYLGVRVLEKFLKKYDIPYDIHWKEKGRENIIVRIGEGEKKLFSAGHIDVVPAGNEKLWKYPPFEGHVEGNIMYGRGTTDNKGPLAALFIAAKVIWQLKNDLNGTFIVSGVADEEKGSVYGTDFLMEKGLIDCDYAIIPDIGGNCKVIDIAEKGVLDVKIITKGKSAHGSTPALGINAIEKMGDLIKALSEYKFKYEEHKYLSPPTMNIGLIKGGNASNMVADKCEIIVNIRYLPSQKKDETKVDLEHFLQAIHKDTEVEIMANLNPTEVNPDNELVTAISMKTKEILGFEPTLIGLGGATVCKTFIENNIPAVGWSPGPDDVAHIANEYVDLKELLKFSQAMAEVVFELLK